MNTFHSKVLIALATFAVSFARADESEAAKKDLAALQGEWTMVSGSADGQPMSAEMSKTMKRICKGDEVTVMMSDTVYLKAKFTLDPLKKPKLIDYAMTDGFTKGKKQLGIYELSGDTFKACFGKPGAERPTGFTSQAGDGRTVSVRKRAKATAESK